MFCYLLGLISDLRCLAVLDTSGILEAGAVAVARPDGIATALAVLKGAGPDGRLGAMLRPPGVIRYQAETPITY